MSRDGQRQEERSLQARALASELNSQLLNGETRIFAVLDAARFTGLPALLNEVDVAHRPLYRYSNGNHATVLGGPWLVDFSQPARPRHAPGDAADDISDEALAARARKLSEDMVTALQAGDPSGGGVLPHSSLSDLPVIRSRLDGVLQLMGDTPAAVFWITDASIVQEAIYRHLRGLNQALIPREGRPASLSPSDYSELRAASVDAHAAHDAPELHAETASTQSPLLYERVVLRHADPNVLVQLFQVFSPDQLTRLMGPARQLLFAPSQEWGGGIKRARRPDGDILPPSGPLRLEAWQVSEMSDFRREHLRRRIMHYLRAVAQDCTQACSDEELAQQVRYSEDVGRAFGIRTERGHAQWAFLMVISKGHVANDPAVRAFLTKPRTDADTQVSEAMKQLVGAAAQQAGAS
ncbi:hypothetical protein [Rhizobium straminoryzae]|uniref:DUF4123 domain-containing protein n=1 Tax=Rhizobium straminoryzae TaxID=1387186 RepID=A0A549TFN5_9HYPH|nr:hypothetical protein [Rhizobium straminoryzae]TRL41338.1 hypothetical protein FNA46_05225 [Rhizobium straminoryzae]